MLLEKIGSPQDLRGLPADELCLLAGEVRRRMIEVVSRTGGHLASSLGAVELIIALHYCLLTPKDKIVFDVGHQAYAHKILTGRNDRFDSLRQYKGVSGFPSKEESAFDPVTSGHSSTAVSQALGIVCAQDFLPAQERARVVAVIGDGSLSGGLCFEGLNHAGHLKKDMLVVLNTNEHSIAPNVGALSTYLNKIISLPIYNRFRGSLENFIHARLPKGSRLIKLANQFEEGLKGLFVPGIFFEELGFRYFGPFNGHDLSVLIPTIKNILEIKGPRIMHVVTKKGKGYAPAERDPVRFHSAGAFTISDGSPAAGSAKPEQTYTQVFSEQLLEMARRDRRIVAITAAMPEGTGLDAFRDAFPDRFFDVGIAEAHAICFAGGLAAAGCRPVVAVYSTFLQRAYDQLIEELCLQKAPVVLALDRAGIVGEDGVTHQGIFDLAFLRAMPHMTVMAPKDGAELAQMLEFALSLNAPAAIRYPKSAVPGASKAVTAVTLGKAEVMRDGGDVAIFALGSMVLPALAAAEILSREKIEACVVNARFVKPLDKELLRAKARQAKAVVTVEDGTVSGGFGSAVGELLQKPVIALGLPDQFIPHGKRALLLENYGLTAAAIAARVSKELTEHGTGIHR